MDLLDKVRLIIGNKCESPSQFADEIGIPRSGVSHLLSGRNKPSLDVIGKIISRYPDLGTDWIWDDEKMPALHIVSTGDLPKAVPVSPARPAKRIERILIFFTDGTFEEFAPND